MLEAGRLRGESQAFDEIAEMIQKELREVHHGGEADDAKFHGATNDDDARSDSSG